MKKPQLILGGILVALMAGVLILWMSELSTGAKVLISIPAAILYLTSCITMAITFFALDEQGRITRGSLTYRYFNWMLGSTKKTDEGKDVQVSLLGDHINLCPAFWLVALGVFVVSGVIAAGVGFPLVVVWIVLEVLQNGWPTGSAALEGFKIVGIIVGAILALVVVTVLAISIYNHLDKKEWGLAKVLFWMVAVVATVAAVATGVYFLAPHVAPWDTPAEEARVAGAILIGKISGVIAGIIVGVVALALAAAFGVPWVANTIVGKMVSGLYHKFCYVIPIEPGDESMGEATGAGPQLA